MTAEPVNYDWPPVHVSLASDDSRDMARLIRDSFAAVDSQALEVSQYFYGALSAVAPGTRDLFPINMSTQRSRLLRALVYVVQMVDRPDELTTLLTQLGWAPPPQVRHLRQALRRRGDRPARRAEAVSEGQVDAGGRSRVDDGVRRHRAHHARGGGSGDRMTVVVRNGDQA